MQRISLPHFFSKVKGAVSGQLQFTDDKKDSKQKLSLTAFFILDLIIRQC
ncbi:hypothetical protein [Lactobacillus helveticus]|nr:hypothetical protein [Lactobacillus helveticus]EEW68824.1 hypothetical protein HMPREF0518_0221 [Lactobacillus helveticus DSM 20075 = CGMCC 1.1877]